jgi:hypothetical protein
MQPLKYNKLSCKFVCNELKVKLLYRENNDEEIRPTITADGIRKHTKRKLIEKKQYIEENLRSLSSKTNLR